MTDKDIHKLALERYKLCEDAWADNFKAAKADMEFRALAHWDAADKKKREDDGRPCLVVDKLNQYVRQVVNDGRQNRPGIKVRPVDDEGDDEIAEALQGIIRHILDRSNADEAFDTALECAVVGGFGFMRVATDYAHEGTFNQEIEVKRIRNPLAVMLDPNCQMADGSDARFGFVIDELSKEVFKSKYPKAAYTDFEAETGKYSDGWESDKNVRVCEYFWKEEIPTDMHLLEDGTTVSDDDYQAAQAEGIEPPQILETRSIPKCKIKWARISGAEVLETNDWRGKYIPIIPVFGNEYDLDGKVTYSGLIRAAKDPQRLYNYSRSAYAERVALAPKAPYIAAAGQVEAYEDQWETANTESHSVLKYDPIDIGGTPVPPPQRQQASDIPEGFARDMQLSEHDIQASMGMYNASLGEKSNEKSGKAILARQREGDVATFHYQDNLNRAIRHLGRILIDLIPKIYDSARAIRILGEDGEQTDARINPEQQVPVAKEGARSIYNLNIGVYDLSVAAGPSYTTKRQEQAEAMLQMAGQANSPIMQIAGDLLVKSMDWPNADALADRFKLMLPPQIQQAISQEGTSPEEQLAQSQAMIAQLQQQMEQIQMQAQEQGQMMADKEKELLSIEQSVKDEVARNEMLKTQIEAAKKVFDADMAAKNAQLSAAVKEAEVSIQGQGLTLQSKQMVLDGKEAVSKEKEQMATGIEQTVQSQSEAIGQLAEAMTQFQQFMGQALQQLTEAQSRTEQTLSKPRKLVRDASGRPTASVIDQ